MARSASGRRTSPRPGASVAPGADDPLALLNELARIATQDLELWPMLQRITDTLSARLGAELVSLVRIDRGGLEPGEPGQFFMLEAVGELAPGPAI